MQNLSMGYSENRYRFGLRYRILNIRWVSLEKSHSFCETLEREG
jgi:hypothetical protein